MPALFEHAAPPGLRERKGFTAARAPFGQEDFAVGQDSKFPVSGAINQGATRAVSRPAHRPQGADVV